MEPVRIKLGERIPYIDLGRAREMNVRKVEFDVSAMVENYGEGEAHLVYRRPTEQKWWPIPLDIEGNIATWTITLHNTYIDGDGECEIQWVVNDGLAKSVLYKTVVRRSGGCRTPDSVPDGYETRIYDAARAAMSDVIRTGNEQSVILEGYADRAAQSAQDAKDLVESAAPTVKVEQTDNGAIIVANDKDGETSVEVKHGRGVDPVESWEEIEIVERSDLDETIHQFNDELNSLSEKVDQIDGFSIVPLSNGQYDADGVPAISEPQEHTLYLTPSGEQGQNLWVEWLYVDGKWEKFGSKTVDLSGYAKTSDIPTNVSQLNNDSGYLTQHQSLDGLAKADLSNINETGEQRIKDLADSAIDLSDYAKADDIPTRVSQLSNDAGYLTQHQSLDGLAKDDLSNLTTAGKQVVRDAADAAVDEAIEIIDGSEHMIVEDKDLESAVNELKGLINDQEKVKEAVGEALSEAKATGEFDGKSAYDTAVSEGFTGTVTEWLSSLKGEAGRGIDPVEEWEEFQLLEPSDLESSDIVAKSGALGDGTTDDSAALQEAFNRSNAVIEGSNKEYKIVEVSINGQHDLVIRDFIFVGGIFLRVRNCKNILFENCTWKDFHDNGIENAKVAAVVLESSYDTLDESNLWGLNTISKNITFDKCMFENIRYCDNWTKYNPVTFNNRPHYSTGMAIRVEGVDELKIQSCKFTQIKGNACIYVNTYGWFGDFDFHDNLFYLNGWGGIELYRCNVLMPNKRRTVHNNRFIGCGLGYVPKDYFDLYYPDSQQTETGVGTAALIGTNNPMYNGEKYDMDTNRCSLMCAVRNNYFIDNNESSVEGSSFNPVLDNYIVGQGAFQTEANRQECIAKYGIDYWTRVRVNPSCNAFYSSGREHDSRDEPYTVRGNVVSRMEGTKGVTNPVMFQGTRKKPFVVENNRFNTLRGEQKWSLIVRSDFRAGMTWRNNAGLPPYFNSTTIRKDYNIDDVQDLYGCTFEDDAYFDVPNTPRFPHVSMMEYDEKVCEIRNTEAAEVDKNGQIKLGYKVLDDNVEPFGEPVYSLAQSPDFNAEIGGVEFDGTKSIDTGVELFGNNGDFTVIVKYRFADICNHKSGSPIKYPNFTFFPVVSCMDYNDSAHGYPGFDIGLMLNDGAGTSSNGGYQCFRNNWKFDGWAQMSKSIDYTTFYNKTYTYIVVKKDGVLYCYDDVLKRKISVSGKRATTIFSGTLQIGKNMVAPALNGKPWSTDEMFQGTVYQCDVYDHAISAASLETEYPTLEDTEASIKGAITMRIKNKEYARHTLRAVCVDMCFDIDGGDTGSEAFEVRLTGNVSGEIKVSDDTSVHRIRKTIPVQPYSDTIQPFGKYGVQIVNSGRSEDTSITIKSVNISAITRRTEMSDADIEVDDFEIIWDKNVNDLAIGEKVGGTGLFYPTNAVIKGNITATVDNASVLSVKVGGRGIEVTTLAEGSALLKVVYGSIEKVYAFDVTEKLVECTRLTLSPSSITILQGKRGTIYANREPLNCTEPVEWWSDNPDICTVDNGLITGISKGNCIVFATCGNYISKTNVEVTKRILPTNESFDISSIVGYVPIDEITTNHTVVVEIDKDKWVKTNTAAKTLITTKSGDVSGGFGFVTLVMPSDANAFELRDYFAQDASAAANAPLKSVVRKRNINSSAFDCIVANYANINRRKIASSTFETATWTDSTGEIAKFNKALYFNCVSDSGSNPDIKGYSTEQIASSLSAGTLTPSMVRGNAYIKSFIVFSNSVYTTFADAIADRENAEIDIRMGSDRKLHNFGKAGELIYADLD